MACIYCYWYEDVNGVCCCPDSEIRAATPEEFFHDPKKWSCDCFRKGVFWDADNPSGI